MNSQVYKKQTPHQIVNQEAVSSSDQLSPILRPSQTWKWSSSRSSTSLWKGHGDMGPGQPNRIACCLSIPSTVLPRVRRSSPYSTWFCIPQRWARLSDCLGGTMGSSMELAVQIKRKARIFALFVKAYTPWSVGRRQTKSGHSSLLRKPLHPEVFTHKWGARLFQHVTSPTTYCQGQK